VSRGAALLSRSDQPHKEAHDRLANPVACPIAPSAGTDTIATLRTGLARATTGRCSTCKGRSVRQTTTSHPLWSSVFRAAFTMSASVAGGLHQSALNYLDAPAGSR